MKRILKAAAVVAVAAMAATMFGCKQQGVLTMATNAEFQPFEYHDGNKIVGIDVDIVSQVAKDLHKTLKISDMEFTSVVASAATGKTDLAAAGLTKDPDRAKSVDFSDPYYDATQVIIVKSDNASIASKNDLKGKKIAVQSGTTGDEQAKKITGDANVQRFNAPTDAITNLINGKADAVILDSFPAKIYVQQNKGLKIIEGGFDTEQYCIAVKKGNKEMLDNINKTIKRLRDSGDLDKIIKKYSK